MTLKMGQNPDHTRFPRKIRRIFRIPGLHWPKIQRISGNPEKSGRIFQTPKTARRSPEPPEIALAISGPRPKTGAIRLVRATMMRVVVSSDFANLTRKCSAKCARSGRNHDPHPRKSANLADFRPAKISRSEIFP